MPVDVKGNVQRLANGLGVVVGSYCLKNLGAA